MGGGAYSGGVGVVERDAQVSLAEKAGRAMMKVGPLSGSLYEGWNPPLHFAGVTGWVGPSTMLGYALSEGTDGLFHELGEFEDQGCLDGDQVGPVE